MEQEVEVVVSGRIPKYMFGVLQEKYRSEVKQALEFCKNEDIETPSQFLSLIFGLTLEGFRDPQEELFEAISKEDLEKLPNLNSLVNDFIENGGSHFEMLDCLLDYPEEGYGYSAGCVSLIEDDATISIYVDEKPIIEAVELKEFANCELWGNSDDDKETDEFKRVKELTESSTAQFILTDPNEGGPNWGINEHGAMFLNDWISFTNWEEFCDSNERENLVTIYFDDITTWSFYFSAENFDIKDLTFVNHNNAEEFRNSSHILFSYLFYKNEQIEPSENWLRDKGITLNYGENRLEDLNFFLYA